MNPDPLWPVLVLAGIQFVDGILCIGPVAFIRRCFQDVNFPERWWWVTPPLKFAAAAGLIVGIRIPMLSPVVVAALILYFVLAVAMHIRARDFGRNLFINAIGMLVTCLAVGFISFVR